MKRIKTLSAEDLIMASGEAGSQNKTILWHHRELVIKQFLSLGEYIKTVRNIINECTDENGNVAVELVDFAIRVNIVNAFAYVELPKETDKLFYVIYSQDGIYDAVCRTANSCQINAIRSAVSMCIGGELK